MKKILIIVIFLGVTTLTGLVALLVVKNLNLPVSAETDTFKPLQQPKMWEIAQSWRESQGFAKYEENEAVCTYANTRLKELYQKCSHDGFNSTSHAWLERNNYEKVGENLLCFTQGDEEKAFSNWLNSPTHRENLDYNYKYSCIRTNGLHAVQIFAE